VPRIKQLKLNQKQLNAAPAPVEVVRVMVSFKRVFVCPKAGHDR